MHAESRHRESIWKAFESREVYATSGERILLWFDLLNGPGGERPMGSAVAGQVEAPRFRVSAAGAFVQQPGCPAFVEEAMGAERLRAICLGECYHPSDERRAIERIEVVRIRPAGPEGPPVADRIEDPWRSFSCEASGEGCEAEFTDLDFAAERGEVVYYARAVQEPTLAVNAGGFRCTYDAEGRCVDVAPCYGDDRTEAHDDCLSENREHAWSSPIFVRP